MHCSRMEPQGCERHRWVKPRGRNERERVSQNLRSLDAILPKKFFAALLECIAATFLHALEQPLH